MKLVSRSFMERIRLIRGLEGVPAGTLAVERVVSPALRAASAPSTANASVSPARHTGRNGAADGAPYACIVAI